MLPLFMSEVPTYEVRGGNMFITVGDFVLACPVSVFLVGCAKGKAAIVQWERERGVGAEVIKLPAGDRGAH